MRVPLPTPEGPDITMGRRSGGWIVGRVRCRSGLLDGFREGTVVLGVIVLRFCHGLWEICVRRPLRYMIPEFDRSG